MKNIEVVMIPVRDQQKAKEFYLQLGFQVLIEAPMGNGESWVQLGVPGQVTSISLMKKKLEGAPEPIRGQGIMLSTDDIEKEVSALKAKGIATRNIDDTPW